MTGVEGYVESAASGIVAAWSAASRFLGKPPTPFPRETAIGALCHYISHFEGKNFQPMNVNFGLIPPLEKGCRKKKKPETGRKGPLGIGRIYGRETVGGREADAIWTSPYGA